VFIPFAKIDEEKRMVTGTFCDETPDLQQEIVDYETTKALVVKWSATMEEKSDGANKGNVRGMHGKDAVAAGMIKELEFDDNAKKMTATAHIVDDNEWEKVKKKVYTGWSLGGRYVGRGTADKVHKGFKRVTINPNHLGLADLSANPSAVFDAVKADGTKERRAGSWKDSIMPLGDDKKIAWKAAHPGEARKGMYEVRSLAQIVSTLAYMAASLERERDNEGDESDVPERFMEAVMIISEVFVDMAHEETAELLKELGITENEE
jgi:hypothetical protein